MQALILNFRRNLAIATSLLLLTACLPELSKSDQILQDAYDNKTSDIQVKGEGEVTRLLSDDTEGDQHQRFIVH